MKPAILYFLLSVVAVHATDYTFKNPAPLRPLGDIHRAEHIPDAVWVISRPQEHGGVKFPQFVMKKDTATGIVQTPLPQREKWLVALITRHPFVKRIQATNTVVLWDAQTGWNKEIFP